MNKKEQQAIDFLCSMECDLPLNLGFSGGKDSVVILDLAERAGIKYNAIYAIVLSFSVTFHILTKPIVLITERTRNFS